jgi:hypothetical protein
LAASIWDAYIQGIRVIIMILIGVGLHQNIQALLYIQQGMLLMMMEEASCIQGIQEMVTITILLSR